MNEKNMIESLFDVSFSSFVTTKLIKIVFIIGLVFAALGTIAIVISSFRTGVLAGLLMLVLSPVIFLVWSLGVRIWCEMVMVIFRIAENTSKLASKD